MPPTYTDFGQMLYDMYEFSQEDSGSIIMCSDDPKQLCIGYLVYYVRGGREIARSYLCPLSRAREWSSKNPSYNIKWPDSPNKESLKLFAKERKERQEQQEQTNIEQQKILEEQIRLARSVFKNPILGLQLED